MHLPALAGAYFNPRSPHGERHADSGAPKISTISTHAPRTGSDAAHPHSCIRTANFNPRSPHGERRRFGALLGATADFNPRSPHGERRRIAILLQPLLHISTHAPRTGSDVEFPGGEIRQIDFNPRSPHGERQTSALAMGFCSIFQPTLPARGATRVHPAAPMTACISTHAPRTGSDALRRTVTQPEQ